MEADHQTLIYVTGLSLLLWRSTVRPRAAAAAREDVRIKFKSVAPSLAIVIPARNEASTLPRLLLSLEPLKKQGARIVVVDDQSTDQTGLIASRGGAEVIQTSSKPDGWSGKNWACHQGALHLKETSFLGQYILFTDADTEHHPENFSQALAWFTSTGAALMTCRPYHRNPSPWEKALGPFQNLVLFITDAHQCFPPKDRCFSIGQFLLFDWKYYWQSRGHLNVRGELAEDLALAKECFERGRRFVVYPHTHLYSTRMYATLQEFIDGWTRNFRLGMKHSSPQTWMETVCVIAATLGSWELWYYLPLVILFAWLQRRQGNYSFWGALLYPLSLSLFVMISLRARWNTALKKPLRWKSRDYLDSAAKN